MHETNTLADQLQAYFVARRDADQRVAAAERAMNEAILEATRLDKLYRRCALWIKADELRSELARTEAAAEAIRAGDDS